MAIVVFHISYYETLNTHVYTEKNIKHKYRDFDMTLRMKCTTNMDHNTLLITKIYYTA